VYAPMKINHWFDFYIDFEETKMKLKSLLSISLVALVASSASFAHSLTDYEAQYKKALEQASRPAEDRKRDAGRKPQQVMQFVGVKPGMKVLDLIASGGYYTEVLAHRVGKNGEVLAHNNKFMREVMEGRFNKELDSRLEKNRLPNVKRFDKEFGEFNLENEIDVATMVLNYHDVYGFPAEKRQAMLNEIKKALKPGGIFMVIDAQANPGKHNPKLHRLNSQIAKDDILKIGFKLVEESAILANPKDDHSKVVFDPSIRGKTDRYLLKFVK